jgi:arginine/lysine/ornithine decarboxylase
LLLRKAGVSPEMHDDRHVVLLPTPFNTGEDFKRLKRALSGLPLAHGLPVQPPVFAAPEQRLTLREAIEAPGETIEAEFGAGRTASECSCPCPPCVPLVMPGELISEKLAETLKNYGVNHIKVVK